jgi:hypothetical protein
MVEHEVHIGSSEVLHMIFVGNMKGRGRPTCKWGDNIKIEVKEIECIQIAQNRIQLWFFKL